MVEGVDLWEQEHPFSSAVDLDESDFPNPLYGYLLTLVLTVLFVVFSYFATDARTVQTSLAGFMILVAVLYLVQVGQIHAVLRKLSDGIYPTSPWGAVGWHFVPFANLVWIVMWPRRVAEWSKGQELPAVPKAWVVQSLAVIWILSRFVVGVLGFMAAFWMISQLAAPLRAAAGLPPRTKRLRGVLVACTVLLGAVLLFGAVSEVAVRTGQVASYEVQTGDQVSPKIRQQLLEGGFLEPDEELVMFYSLVFYDIEQEGNLLTDRRVVSWAVAEDGELYLGEAAYGEITSVEKVSLSVIEQHSSLTVHLGAEDYLQLYAPIFNGGDDAMLAELERRVESARIVPAPGPQAEALSPPPEAPE